MPEVKSLLQLARIPRQGATYRQKRIFLNHAFDLLGMRTQRSSEFGQNRLELVRIACCNSLSAQLADSSFQGYVEGHDRHTILPEELVTVR